MICWIESVDPFADLCLTNQIYSVLLDAFVFKEITEVQNAQFNILLEDDETRTRRCKILKCSEMVLEDGEVYPTPQCALSKILPETTVRA